ncbi:hypothetical protein GCM10023189_23410 [Nibrella saemangeumensis]|uniref:Uncharacterized protein n=2 Tax=Nibrella saemangeumensis TaxID=1084526 RepID=A0ABP8MVN3_9BACT
MHPDPQGALAVYRQNLALLRQEHTNQQELPDMKFFLFGMGNRTKLIYQKGRLMEAQTGHIVEQWRVQQALIVPSEYLVHLTLMDSTTVQIREDENGVWIHQPGKSPQLVKGTRNRLNLPTFADKKYGPVLRVLHHEVLINIIAGKPVPNFLVYSRPWFRDAALMGMVMQQTNNLHLIKDWIMKIRDPFDRNNRGISEADNLGQVLFLVSLVSDQKHPAVKMVLDSVKRFGKPLLPSVTDTIAVRPIAQSSTAPHLPDKIYLSGKTDYAEHPVFQTKWIKYGLKSLGLPDPYTIPTVYDSYSALFWWDYTDQHVPGKPFNESSGRNYPYLTWAEDHFNSRTGTLVRRGMVGSVDYPLSWEQQASEANYAGMTILDKNLMKQKLSFPHTWHAAEMFLLLIE